MLRYTDTDDLKDKEKMMTDFNYEEMATCTSGEDVRPESVRVILEDIDAILKELFNELSRIDDAIYSIDNCLNTTESNEPSAVEGILKTLTRQRDVADYLLHLAFHIRDGLW